MIKSVTYGNFLLPNAKSVYVKTSAGQTWEYLRDGISESEVKERIKKEGKQNAILNLIAERRLMPIYGGIINLNDDE